MFKRILITLMAAAMLLFAFGCNTVPPLSDKFDEAAVKKAAEEVIVYFNTQDSEAIRGISDETLKAMLTDERLQEIYTAILANGAFVDFGDAVTFGSSDKATGTEYAVVVVKANYETKAFTYTISFDTDMKLAGIYYK